MKSILRIALLTVLIIGMPAFTDNLLASGTSHDGFGPWIPRLTAYSDGDIISEDTTWDSDVLIDGVLFVPENVTLTIKPGIFVMFTKSDVRYRESGISEAVIPGSGIRVEGKIIAEGTPDAFITFTAEKMDSEPGDWGCIFFDHSKGSSFRYCRFNYSEYTIHAHFSSLDISRCSITKNVDGSRLGYSKINIDHCDVTGNTGKGLNFANCRNVVRYCNITDNYEGIFLNEHDAKCVIEENNIYDNTCFDLSLGEFHDEDIETGVNWWGTAEPDKISAKVYDKSDDKEIGEAHISPAKREVPNAGVDGLEVRLNWKFKTGGYVDSSPAIQDGKVYFGSWDHNFYCIDENTGELVWKFETGDCVDSSPEVSDGKVYFGSWDRNIYCLDAGTGKELWRFEMEASNFDDHRQASPVVSDGVVYMGGFNGFLYALDALTGRLIWTFKTGGPLRSRPLVLSGFLRLTVGGKSFPEIIAASCDGSVYALSGQDKSVLWRFEAGDRVTSSPLITGKDVVFGGGDGLVHSVDRVTGGSVWSFRTGGRIEYSSPARAGNMVLAGSTDNRLYAIDADSGEAVWSFDTGGVIYSSPQAYTHMVVTSNNGGEVWWLDELSGTPKAVFHAKDAVQGLFTATDGTVYVSSRDGYLYSISIGK